MIVLPGIFSRRKYQHLNKVLISEDALRHNYKIIQKLHTEAKVCPVLKSNAYGHGIKVVAPVFDTLNTPFLAVDSLYEAYELYKLKIKTPILVLGYTKPINFEVKKLPFHYVVYDLELARVLNKYQPGCSIHIFIDTGMHREGVKLENLRSFIKSLKKLRNLKIDGACSHFADADNPDNLTATNKQIVVFKKGLRIMEQEGLSPKWRHIAASAGSMKLKDNTFNMLRVGLAMYGINPLMKNDKHFGTARLKPALKFVSTIVQIKELKKGDKVGYSHTYKASNDTKIAVLAAGYYEGVDRRLSNKGVVEIGKVFCPIIGRISMNMTTIDVTMVKKPFVGQEVVIYSDKPEDKNSIYNSALLTNTIAYELLVNIAESVRRELI